MSLSQHDIYLKAFALLHTAHVKAAQRRSGPALELVGYLHHIKMCHSALSPEARAVWLSGRATTPEQYDAIRPYLKSVPLKRAPETRSGKTYRANGDRETARRRRQMAR